MLDESGRQSRQGSPDGLGLFFFFFLFLKNKARVDRKILERLKKK